MQKAICAADIRREQQDVRQAPRAHRRHRLAAGRGAFARRDRRRHGRLRLHRGRYLWTDDHLDRRSIRIARPDTLAVRQRMRIAAPVRPDPAGHRFEVFFVGAEAQVLELLGLAGRMHGAPAVGMAVRAEVEPVAVAACIEPERLIEPLGVGNVGHAEREPVQRVNAQRIPAARRGGLRIHGRGSGSGQSRARNAPAFRKDSTTRRRRGPPGPRCRFRRASPDRRMYDHCLPVNRGPLALTR